MKPPARAERAGAADALVGSFDRLHSQASAVFDDHALADIEPAHFFGQRPAEFDIFQLGLGGGEASELSEFHKQLRGKI